MQDRINNLLDFCFDDEQSIEFQLFLITVKCLIPFENNIGCLFDKERYKKEIELFAHYMNSNDETIDYWLKNKKPSNMNDELLQFKIIPIVLSNTVWENLIDEVLKAVTFYTLNKNTILNALLISSAIYEFMNNAEIESIEGASRERLINFSIKEFCAKNEIDTDKNYIIDFEKERIKMVAKPMLFGDKDIYSCKVINYIFGKKSAADNNFNVYTDKTIETLTDNERVSSNNNSPKHSTDNNTDLLNSFSIYLYKLRKGSINPEKLIISDKIPDIKECLKYPEFSHPLLGRCKVIQRTENEALVRSKSGLMRIRI
ncbi:MAG: hypothetical protein PHP29_08520 [Tissierellia bacterium]|nr:hypothetical protein [Tissierellia bacterium]